MISIADIYHLCLLAAMLAGMYAYRRADSAARIIVWLVSVDVITEFIARYTAVYYHNNIPVYTIHSLVEFGLVSVYFSKSVDVLRPKIIYPLVTAVIAWGIINILAVQGINRMNSYFLIVEGLCIIGMALLSFIRLLVQDNELQLYKHPHFWFALALMFFWTVLFFNWSLYDYMRVRRPGGMWLAGLSILIVNIITYGGISLIFILYPKSASNE